ncbi:serine/threonine protein kinase, partial [Streptomyces sp. NPDC059744]
RAADWAVRWAQQFDPPPPLTGRRPDLPPAVDDVLAKALSKSPDDRYDSCLQFVAALRSAARSTVQKDHPPTQVDQRIGAWATGPEPPPTPPHWALPVFPGFVR